MVIFHVVLFDVVFVVLFWFGARDKPDGDECIEEDDDEEVEGEHEEVGFGLFVVEGNDGGSEGDDVQEEADDGEDVERGQFACVFDVDGRFGEEFGVGDQAETVVGQSANC